MSPSTPEFRQKLFAALLSAFPTRSSLEQMVYFELKEPLNEIAAESNLRDSVTALVQWAESQERMDRLLASARRANPGNLALKALSMGIIRAAPATIAAAASTASAAEIAELYDVGLLDGDRPFIDRMALREHLRSLAEGKAHALVVSGPPQSGRSYSWELIYHVTRTLGVRVAYLCVDGEAEAAMLDPETVARRLATEVGLGDDLPPDLGSNRARMLAQWLVAAFVNSGERWWLVLDGFEHPTVPSSTHDLLGHMMGTAESPGLRGRLVSILLAYDTRMVPQRLQPHVLVEQLTPLSHGDVASFFERHLRGLGKPYDYALAAELSNRAMEGMQQNGLAGLNDSVIALVRALRHQL